MGRVQAEYVWCWGNLGHGMLRRLRALPCTLWADAAHTSPIALSFLHRLARRGRCLSGVFCHLLGFMLFCCCFAAAQATAAGAEEGEVWSFLGLLFESDGRRELLRRLGFGDAMAPEPSPETAAHGDAQGTTDGVAAGVEAMALSGGGAAAGASAGGAPEDFFEQHDEEFFDKLPDQVGGAGAQCPSVDSRSGFAQGLSLGRGQLCGGRVFPKLS